MIQNTIDLEHALAKTRQVRERAAGLVGQMERECLACAERREAENRMDLLQAVTGRSGLDTTMGDARELLAAIDAVAVEAERLAGVRTCATTPTTTTTTRAEPVVVVASEPRQSATRAAPQHAAHSA